MVWRLLGCAPTSATHTVLTARGRREPIPAPITRRDPFPLAGNSFLLLKEPSAEAAPGTRARLAAEQQWVLSPTCPSPRLYSSPGS